MAKRNVIFKFQAGYGVVGEVWKGMDRCSICKVSTECIKIDNTEEEFLNICMCTDCLRVLRKWLR